VIRFLKDSRGSASIEFVVLAVPLFLPIFIFLNNFADSSDTQSSLRSLARETARAFVTSDNDEIANQVAAQVIFEGGKALGFRNSIRYSINCSQSPCIYPDGRVSVTVVARLRNLDEVEVSAIEYVSPWT
jgi:Flp pilus assembly protein TadG